MTAQLLVTMDDLETAVPLNAALEEAGYQTTLLSSLDDTRKTVRRVKPELVVLTGAVHEPRATLLAALAREQEISSIALLEATDSERARSQLGVTDMLVKPVSSEDVLATVRRVLRWREMQQRTGIVGESPAIHEMLVKIEQMAPASSTVIIEGESGTGKELVARAIHDFSPRRGESFVTVNCAALPETLLESELFGHEKGAFTGAAERRLGRFELADRGTIFLDEIGEISPSVQVKLLGVLESRTFFRVGGTEPIHVNVRVVAATNRNLKELVALGDFREDLYYRLNVLNIYLPPLRERRTDIPLLVRRFIGEFARDPDTPFRGITREAMQRLVAAPWPGNVRQLRNLVESMVVLAPGTEIRASDIPEDVFEGPMLLPVRVGVHLDERQAAGSRELEFILRNIMDLRIQVENLRRRVDEGPHRVEVIEVAETPMVADVVSEVEAVGVDEIVYRPGMTMAQVEKAAIEAALQEANGNRRQAAGVLGIGERTLYRKIKSYQLD
ncbi:MAG: sigma-54 dependent transcriptional regulator [Gemmatimonadales bacterium]